MKRINESTRYNLTIINKKDLGKVSIRSIIAIETILCNLFVIANYTLYVQDFLISIEI